jgi:hypothetical protein
MQVISFIRTLDFKNASLADLVVELSSEGYVNSQGDSYSELEVKD